MHDIDHVANEIAERIPEEVDYQREAADIAAFSDLYRGHPFIRVRRWFPRRPAIRY